MGRLHLVRRWLWFAGGVTALALAVVGVFLPLLPTTPFVILAAGCFAQSSPRLHDWLLRHPLFGPAIRDWRNHRAIPPRAKTAAVIAMAAAFGLSLYMRLPGWVLLAQGAVLLTSGGWIVTRPSGPRG